MSPRRLATLLATAALALGANACSEDPEPIIAPPSPSPTPSEPAASPTDDSTEAPEDETAEEFIRRWQAASFEMQNSGKTDLYLALSTGCTSCESLAAGIEDIYGDGGAVRGAGGAVLDIRRAGKVAETLVYEFRVRTSPSAVLDSNGNVETRLTGGTGTYQINLTRNSGEWSVARVSRLIS
jgi:hypothetical protein